MNRVKSRRGRGNSFIEFALVLLPLFALMFAITDFGTCTLPNPKTYRMFPPLCGSATSTG